MVAGQSGSPCLTQYLKGAEVRFELDRRGRQVSDEELIADLKRVAELLGNDRLTWSEYHDHGPYNGDTFMRHFGSWNAAIDRAGLSRTVSRNVSQADLFANLEEVWTKLGRQPRKTDLRRPLSCYTVKPYQTAFGGWWKAREAFIEYVNTAEEPALEEALQQEGAQAPERRHRTQRGFSDRQRFLIFRRDNFKCVLCGRSPATDPDIILVADHKKPWSKGGETTGDNGQTTCSRCNAGKSDLPMIPE